jgi:hypothetical protein
LKYSHDSGVTWHTVLIPEGSYELDDINQATEQQMKQNNHYDKLLNQSFIMLSPNNSTLKSIIEISGNYEGDFREANSLNTLLGFDDKVYHAGYLESENIVNILTLNTILVELGSYVRGSRKPVIYSFFPNVSPGYKIVETPRNLVSLPMNTDDISEVHIRLTDQDGKLLNLRGEKVTIKFHVREI